jgi:hypothetical protein
VRHALLLVEDVDEAEGATLVRGIGDDVINGKTKRKRGFRPFCDLLRNESLQTILRQAFNRRIPSALNGSHLVHGRDKVVEDRRGLPIKAFGVGAAGVIKSEEARVLGHDDGRVARRTMTVLEEKTRALF